MTQRPYFRSNNCFGVVSTRKWFPCLYMNGWLPGSSSCCCGLLDALEGGQIGEQSAICLSTGRLESDPNLELVGCCRSASDCLDFAEGTALPRQTERVRDWRTFCRHSFIRLSVEWTSFRHNSSTLTSPNFQRNRCQASPCGYLPWQGCRHPNTALARSQGAFVSCFWCTCQWAPKSLRSTRGESLFVGYGCRTCFDRNSYQLSNQKSLLFRMLRHVLKYLSRLFAK